MNINLVKSQLEDKIERLEKIAIQLQPSERIELVAQIIETYYKAVGKYPDTNSLIRLSNVILVEEIKDRKKNKSKTKEYPFLSDRQLLTRMKKEFSLEDDTIDFLHQKEVKKMDSAFKKRTQNMED
jgi:hypothetical protein